MQPIDVNQFRNILVGEYDAEIVGAEARLRAAQLAGDFIALESLLSEELLFTGPDGRLATKADDLAAHRSGVIRFREHEPMELRVRRLGPHAAIAALLARLAVEVHGNLEAGTFRYTRVWVREGGLWRVAGGHVAAVPDQANEPAA